VLRYRLLGSSGLRVSELALGTMTFGEAWGWGAGEEECGRILDAYLDAGGNFIDTASNYTDGQSEEILGRLLGTRRDRIVLATKYTLTSDRADPNAGGNHRKSLMRSLERSLRRLRTDYVDLLWMHMWDGLTPIDEVMRALDDAVAGGKVLHIGISDTPAWVIARADAIAELRGWERPAAIQLPYSIASRDAERELLPFAAARGLAVCAWGVLGGGMLTGKYAPGNAEPRRYGDVQVSDARRGLIAALESGAADLGCSKAQLVIAWLLSRRDRVNVIPILGARTAAQLAENVAAVELLPTVDGLERLEAASPPTLGFPGDFLADEEVIDLIFGTTRPLIDA
jgi:aryl-alcohol dehydrogenase-like predicted oxidoreductase